MIGLRLCRRRDGSLCLTDAAGNPNSDVREFPAEHSFSYEMLNRESACFATDGDKLTLTLANAKAEYEIVDRDNGGVFVKLVSSELSDAPAIDEAKADELAAARAAVDEAGETTQAQPGQAVVTEG